MAADFERGDRLPLFGRFFGRPNRSSRAKDVIMGVL